MTLNEFNFKANHFLTRVFTELERKNIKLEKNWHIDHLCFRTDSQENYITTKKQFETFSELLIESEVNGRLISTYKLASPVAFNEWEINLVEVPAPKKGKSVVSGFEHIEIVCDITFDEIKSRFHHCQFDESGLSKDFNQELEIPLDGLAVKFHLLSLESVINLEANSKVYSALNSSLILKKLKSFSPLVAGTFPLGIHTDNSDIDILITVSDFELTKKVIVENFKSLTNFNLRETLIEGMKTLIASFSFLDIRFEIFGQQTSSVKQTGYLHFLIEERLLKIGGAQFAQKIRDARKQGLKTEPAFAKVLGLTGDPYQELLNLQRKSNADLKDLIK
jgi:predicted metalloenzyme YecM